MVGRAVSPAAHLAGGVPSLAASLPPMRSAAQDKALLDRTRKILREGAGEVGALLPSNRPNPETFLNALRKAQALIGKDSPLMPALVEQATHQVSCSPKLLDISLEMLASEFGGADMPLPCLSAMVSYLAHMHPIGFPDELSRIVDAIRPEPASGIAYGSARGDEGHHPSDKIKTVLIHSVFTALPRIDTEDDRVAIGALLDIVCTAPPDRDQKQASQRAALLGMKEVDAIARPLGLALVAAKDIKRVERAFECVCNRIDTFELLSRLVNEVIPTVTSNHPTDAPNELDGWKKLNVMVTVVTRRVSPDREAGDGRASAGEIALAKVLAMPLAKALVLRADDAKRLLIALVKEIDSPALRRQLVEEIRAVNGGVERLPAREKPGAAGQAQGRVSSGEHPRPVTPSGPAVSLQAQANGARREDGKNGGALEKIRVQVVDVSKADNNALTEDVNRASGDLE